MRNSTMRLTKKLSITFALALLVVCMAILTISTVTPSSDVVAEALSGDTTTLLASGTGLQYGANKIRTTLDDFYVQGTDSGSAVFGSSNMSGAGTFQFITKAETMAGGTNYASLNPNASVFYGILDADITTVFDFWVDISLGASLASDNITIVLSAYFSTDIGSSGMIPESYSETIVTIDKGSRYDARRNVSVEIGGQQYPTGGSHLNVTMAVTSGNNTVFFSNPRIDVKGVVNAMSINNSRGVSLQVEGKNRSTVTISNVYDANSQSELDSLYVKEGDVLTFRSEFEDNNGGESQAQTFSPFFAAAMGRAGYSCVDWHTFYNSNYSSAKSYLQRIDSQAPGEIYSGRDEREQAYQGTLASFVVTAGVTNARNLQIIPRLYAETDGNAYQYWLPSYNSMQSDLDKYTINIKVDNRAPESPKLDDTLSLGLAIKNKDWFTTSSSLKLEYVESEEMDRVGVAEEQVYAFLVDTAFSDFPTNYDFAPGNTRYYTYKAGSKEYTARRQELGAYSNSLEEGVKNPLVFDMPGKYGLILYTVDSAGNVSSPTLYTANQAGTPILKVDWTTKDTGMLINYGSSTIAPSKNNRDKFTSYATVNVLAGPAYHDEDGNCTFDINELQPSSAVTSYVKVKRDIYVTVRITMTKEQYDNYTLVSYNIGNRSVDNPTYVEDKFGNRIFDVTFEMDDTLWDENAITERPVKGYFHRRVGLELRTDDPFVFTYTDSAKKITFANNMEAYIDGGLQETIWQQPKIGVEYFKPTIVTVQSEYTVNENGQIMLEGGGYIIIDNVHYAIGDDFDQHAFVRGEIPFVVGEHEYYLKHQLSATDLNDGGVEYKVYEMRGYDLSAGNQEGYADAGTYFYRAYVIADDNTHYYGEKIDSYVIEKADPGVIDPFASNELTYGQSLGELIFLSYDKGNMVIDNNRVLVIGDEIYQLVSSGLYGQFVIEVPTIGSDDYEQHKVEKEFKITVSFRPIDLEALLLTPDVIKNNYEILKVYYDRTVNELGNITGYTIREGTQSSLNYNTVNLSIAVTINHKGAFVTADDESLIHYYDGSQKKVEATVSTIENDTLVTIPNQPLIYEYKLHGADDSTYTTQAPEQAGQYTVRISIDTVKSNYISNDYEIRDMIIYKRSLEISVDPTVTEHSVLSEEISAGNASSNEMLTYTYSHTKSATYVAGYYDDLGFQKIGGLLYNFSFYKYAYFGVKGEVVMLTDSEWTEAVNVISSTLLDAGRYMMRVQIDNQNNEGEKYILVDVNQVRPQDETKLSISIPTAKATYDIIELDGNNRGQGGHLEYGQTLSSMRDVILGNQGSAKFTPRGANLPVTVASRFVFESEEDYVNRLHSTSGAVVELPRNASGELILPVSYNAEGRIVSYEINMIWQAGSLVEGEFVPDYNFRNVEFQLSIYVVRAQADFSQFKLSDITYGQAIGDGNSQDSNAKFEGTIDAHGFNFLDGTNKLYTMTILEPTYKPQGGDNLVKCNFTPSDELLDKYLPLENVDIPLYVNKKEVSIAFTTDHVDPVYDLGESEGSKYPAVKYVYGNNYVNPAVTITADGVSGASDLVPQFFFLRTYTQGETLKEGESLYEYTDSQGKATTYVRLSSINASTPIGRYKVVAEILESERNFTGSTIYDCAVIKGTLYVKGVMAEKVIYYGDNVNQVDFGTVTLVNEPTGNDTKYVRGTLKVYYVRKDGAGNVVFESDDYTPPVNVDGTINTKLVFTPLDSMKSEYQNYHAFSMNYYLMVAKLDLSEYVVVEGMNEEGKVEFTFNNTDQTVNVSLNYVANEPLNLMVNYMGDHKNAGESLVQVVMEADNYMVDYTFTMVINKATATLTNTSDIVKYTALVQPFVPQVEVDVGGTDTSLFEYNISYKDYQGNPLTSVPSDVGRYTVEVELINDNFIMETTVGYSIAPALSGYANLTQTYREIKDGGATPIAPVYEDITINGIPTTHPNVKYVVYYKDVFGEFVTIMPQEAGTYEVKFRFDHRGFIFEDELTLVINKANVVVMVNENYTSTYNTLVNPLSLKLEYDYELSYKLIGEGDEAYTTVAPTNVGDYDVKVELKEDNYIGVAYTKYHIYKGDLSVRILPTVLESYHNGNVVFNDDASLIPLDYYDGGENGESDVQFMLGGVSVKKILGEWKIVTDLSTYRVGVHNVTIVFYPENKNFNNLETTIDVNIIKKDITDQIYFSDEPEFDGNNFIFNYEFTKEGIGITPVLVGEVPYGDKITFSVIYDGAARLPVNVKSGGMGTILPYSVSVTLNDVNYTGFLNNVLLYVNPEYDLDIVAPTFKPINKGDTLDNSYIISNTGGAYLSSNGKLIQGRFSILEDYCTTMDKANMRPIEVQFLPSEDVNNVASPIFTAYVKVMGKDPLLDSAPLFTLGDVRVTQKAGTDVIYGAPLSSYEVSIINPNVQGTVRWANPDQIIKVGEQAEFIFTPTGTTDGVNNYDVYNEKSILITIPEANKVQSAEMIFSDDSYVILYEGQTLSSATPVVRVFNAYLAGLGTLTPEQEKVYEVLSTEYELTLVASHPDYVATQSDLGRYLEGMEVTITIRHPNYVTKTQTFPVFVKRIVDEFKNANDGKFFDGKVVTMQDFGIDVVDSDYTITPDDLVFKKILLNGKEVSEIYEAGVYTITIEIMEDVIGENGTELSGSHVGSYTFTYTINKKDLSDSIELYLLKGITQDKVEVSEGTIYADSVSPKAEFGGIEVDAKTITYTYFSSDGAYSYGTLPPTDAGEYKIKVSVQGNPYYEGTATFDYVIYKKEATISLENGYFFSYNPSIPVDIQPIISNNIGKEYVQISYYPTGGNVGTTEKPVNVGSYRVVVNIVNHPNMRGSATTNLTIDPASTMVTIVPAVGAIKYGTPLKNSRITGGEVETLSGDKVDGTFSFEYPELNTLSVGSRTVNMIFTPSNANYAKCNVEVNIIIEKAFLSVEFSSLEKVYTGAPLYPDIILKEDILVTYSFRQGNINYVDAINAGTYQVTVTVIDNNYEGSTVANFTIYKARAIEIGTDLGGKPTSIAPTFAPITYGQALNNGAIEGGSVVYVVGKNGVQGSFSYLDRDKVLGDVGVYEGVRVIFTPNDSLNYETYTFTTSVEIVKAYATISVSANKFVYGESLVSPVFQTTPQGLKVDNNEFESIRGTIQKVGNYLFTARIDEKNYRGEILYSITVEKKPLRVAFYREGINVSAYNANYGNVYKAEAKVISDSLVYTDLGDIDAINALITYEYKNLDTGVSNFLLPSVIGNYTVTVHMVHNDYYIDPDYATVEYNVGKAYVDSIEFDVNSLSKQVYGSVTMPLVSTTPAGVGYVIDFPGYAGMPTNAGTYTMRVTIEDENYFASTRSATFRINPKEISVENLVAYSKSYDGLPYIQVTGELKGVMNNDDADVLITARTKDSKTNVGVHSVEIVSSEIIGLHKGNYVLRDPIYNLATKITSKVITDVNTGSYITSPEGFGTNITVNFNEVYDTVDNTNFFTQMLGQKATVQVINIKENGLNTVLDSKVKFYVLIPEEYRDAKNLTVEGMGNLENVIITREGDYVTFYADSSGEIVFYKNDFPYWIVIVGAVVGMIVIGGIFALIALPIRRRKRIPNDARSAYKWNENLDGKEHAFRKKVEQEIIEKKRRWRY